jgi:hypothetical protein
MLPFIRLAIVIQIRYKISKDFIMGCDIHSTAIASGIDISFDFDIRGY